MTLQDYLTRNLQDLQLRGMAPSTQDDYCRAVRKISEHYNKLPNQITEEKIREYFLYLKNVIGQRSPLSGHHTNTGSRVALSNRRIIKLEACPERSRRACPERSRRNDRVTFIYKHPKTKQWTATTLPVFEFIRRFLQRMLPRGFKKVRHFGFLASRNKSASRRSASALSASSRTRYAGHRRA